MKVKCSNCEKGYSIDIEKLKKMNKTKFKCIQCEAIISIDIERAVKPDLSYGLGLKEDILKKVKALPPMPQVLVKAREIINDQNKGPNELAEILEKDQTITTRILKIANSAYYALTTPVSSVKQACVILGEKSLLMLITVVSASRLMDANLKGYEIKSIEMFKHSLRVALGSQKLAKEIRPELQEDAYSAELIHDIGKLILDKYIFEQKESFDKSLSVMDVVAAERSLFGFDHMDIGFDYSINWHIPDIQAQAIKWHHYPDINSFDSNALSFFLHVADKLANFPLEEDASDDEISELIDGMILKKINLDPKQLRLIFAEVREATDQITESIMQ
jgi:HD-like signal output (HDOD) protein